MVNSCRAPRRSTVKGIAIRLGRSGWYERRPRHSLRFPSRLIASYVPVPLFGVFRRDNFAQNIKHPPEPVSYSQCMNLDYRSTWETYVSSWKAPSANEKQSALELSASADCVYRDPLASTTGYEGLVKYMLAFHQQVPGGYFETTWFLAHHDRSIAKWNMRGSDGAILGEGVSYGEYGQDGRLVTMTGFFDAPPA